MILDDTYNANPQSMRAAISVLSDRRSQWSIAVLGDMFELGPFAPALHTGWGSAWARPASTAWWRWGSWRSTSPRGPGTRRAPGVPLQRQGGGQACPGPAGPAGQHHFSEGVPRDGAGGADRLPALHHPGRRSDPQGPPPGRTVWKARLREGPSQRPTQERQRTVMIDIAISGLGQGI